MYGEEKDCFEECTVPLLKETLSQFATTIQDIRQSRSKVLSYNDVCEKFAILNVAVYECVCKILKLVEDCRLLKFNQRRPEFEKWLREEVVQFVEACPTDPKWEEIMKLSLQLELDPDLVDDDMLV